MSARPRKKPKNSRQIAMKSYPRSAAEEELMFIFALDKGIIPLPAVPGGAKTPSQKPRKASRKFRKLWRQWYQVRKSQGLRMSSRDIYSDPPVKGFIKVRSKARTNRKMIINDYLVRKARKVLNNE